MINETGNKFPCQRVTSKLINNDSISDGIFWGNLVLINNFNCIGEPTTPIFRKKDLIKLLGYFTNRKYSCNVDTAT